MELLSPAGDEEALEAALAMGADSVYFGLDCGFNARRRTGNFQADTLSDTVQRIHDRGVRAYLTVNTLIFEPELIGVTAILRLAEACGIDAFIIQDPSVALLAAEVAPSVERHASTQMTVSSGEAARFVESLGISRIVVPRELSVSEIASFARETSIELEVFIHGALCVAWSGQCLTSEAWAGRSANRGQCNQSCRMPYDLLVDGEVRQLGEQRYLLSPRDLMGADTVAHLAKAGVSTLKIEGRQKGWQYVATATGAYRDLLDENDNSPSKARERFDEASSELSLSFSRGFGGGFLSGINHQQLVDGRFPKHRGLLLGEVLHVDESAVEVKLNAEEENATNRIDAAELRRGMGVVFDAGDPEDKNEPGGPIFDIRESNDTVSLFFGDPGPNLAQVRIGQRVWVTSNPAIGKSLRGRLNKKGKAGRCGVAVTAHGEIGSPLRVTAQARWGQTAEALSRSLLTKATSRGLDAITLREKLGAWGDTPFFLESLQQEELDDGCFLPVRELKTIRRELLSELTKPTAGLRQPTPESDTEVVAKVLAALPIDERPPGEKDALLPLCRTREQLEAVIDLELPTVELDFMELVGLKRAVSRAREAGLQVVVASLRIQKQGEDGFGAALEQVKPDAVLVRHWGALDRFRHEKHSEIELHGDFSLNVTNSITARHLLRCGLSTVTASHDLDRDQLMQLAQALPANTLTVPVQHRIPTFHTEHCVYAHVLSEGTTHLDCGRPCEKHELSLVDHKGLEHPVIVDAACRNTVFHGEGHSAGWMIPELREVGVHRFRVEFVRETREEARHTLQVWMDLLDGKCSSKDLSAATGTREQFGIAEGGMVIAPLEV